ncbi:MAG: phosphotransferase [Candidatus Izemoplasmatales bacterium]|nr:phosphotransferase [Candidatus Izemoplasmatales bacterium]
MRKTKSESGLRIPFIIEVIKKYYKEPILSVLYLGGGSYGFVYKVTFEKSYKPVVVKGYRVNGMHKTEKFQTELLSKNTSVKMPEIYHVFDHSEDVPFDAIIMEYIDGVDGFTTPSLLLKSSSTRKAFARSVVDGMVQIHMAKNDKFGYVESPTYDTWQEFYLTIVAFVQTGTQQLLIEKKIKPKYAKMMDYITSIFEQVFDEFIEDATLIHGDLNVMNMLVNPKKLELVAFIDPFNSMWADRDYDLFQLNNLTGKRFFLFRTYENTVKLSSKTHLKCAYYAYVNELLCYILSGFTLEFLLNFVYNSLRNELKKAELL